MRPDKGKDKMHVGTKLGGADNVSIRSLSGWPNGFCIHPEIEDADGRVLDFFIERYFESGAALFGRESWEEINDFRGVSGLDMPDRELQDVIEYAVKRIRNSAHIESLFHSGFKQARIVGDPRNCPNAREHDGKLLDVAELRSEVQRQSSLSRTDYSSSVYGSDLGIPPFQLGCNCSLEGYFAYLD